MNSPFILALVSLVGIIGTALITYLATRRKQSGTIATSEAADLWGQTQAIIKTLNDQLQMATAESAASRAESMQLRQELEVVRQELRRLRAELVQLQAAGKP